MPKTIGLYVAATRAGAFLGVTLREERANENPWRTLAEDLSGRDSHPDPGPQVRPVRPTVAVSAADVDAAAE